MEHSPVPLTQRCPWHGNQITDWFREFHLCVPEYCKEDTKWDTALSSLFRRALIFYSSLLRTALSLTQPGPGQSWKKNKCKFIFIRMKMNSICHLNKDIICLFELSKYFKQNICYIECLCIKKTKLLSHMQNILSHCPLKA